MRLWGKTIASTTSNHIQGLCTVSKDTLYRTFLNARINWRMFLTKITLRFHGILQERQVDTDENDTCAILDDTTFQKKEQGLRFDFKATKGAVQGKTECKKSGQGTQG